MRGGAGKEEVEHGSERIQVKAKPVHWWAKGGRVMPASRPPFVSQCTGRALNWILSLPCSTSSFPAPPSLCHGFLTLQGLPRRCNFFCWVNFPSPNLPQQSPLELRTRTFQKPTAQREVKNTPKAKNFEKPTPEWDTIKRRENHVAF